MEIPDLLPAPSHIHGKTWRRLRSGGFWLPEKNRTLGDQVINWMVRYLRDPGGNGHFMPTDEQYRLILWWYAIDENGRFTHRKAVMRRMKGHGKDPLVAALGLTDLCGPVVFDRWDAFGMPVAKPHHQAWVQIVAVSHSQTKNTFRVFPALASKELKQEYGLDINQTVIHSSNGGLIEGVTSSWASMEGNRPTLVILNEIQEWVDANNGHDLFGVIEGNVTKIPVARWFAVCNAHRPGEESVGEKVWNEYQRVLSGSSVDTGLMYDALEAPADTPVSEIPAKAVDPEGHEKGLQMLREGLEIAHGDSTWVPLDDVLASVLSTTNPITESRRKYLNQINASEDSWISPTEWDRCHAVVQLEDRDTITLGFDGSISGDHTALTACRVSDGAIFTLKVWNPEDYADGEVPKGQVDAMVHHVFSKYKVVAFRADVYGFESYVDAWSARYHKKLKIKASPNKPIAFDMRGKDSTAVRKRFALDCERFLDAVLEGGLMHNGDTTLRTHIINCYRHYTEYETISIRKVTRHSPRKIDAAVTAVMAYGLRQEYLMTTKHKTGKAAVFA